MSEVSALDGLSLEEKLELLELLEIKDRRRRTNWLKHYRPYAKQREFHERGATFRERLFSAGNQLGKTYSGAAEVAMHATGLYPDWWTGYRFRRPTRWVVGSESAELTRKGVQRLLLGPPETRDEWGTGAIPKSHLKGWSMKPGVPDAVASITVKNEYGGESVIQFNSYDQGRSKWQADTLDGVWCVAEGQRVLLADGTYVPIERVRPGDVVVTTDGRGRRAEARVSAVHDNGVRDVVEVRMARGPWLVMTPDHEVYTTTSRKTPVAAAERVLQVLPGWEPRETKDREDAWYAWLGLVLAEGSVSCRKITMADGDAVQQAKAMLPGGAYVRRKDMPGAHVPDWFLNWPEFWEQVDPGLAHEKQIPDWVFRSSNAKVAQFLAYLYAGDGWASGKTIGYASTSRLLAEQVSVLLARLGIRGSVNKKVSTRENWRDQWWVLINSADAVLRFVDSVAVPGKAPAMARARVEAERRAAVRPRSGRYPNGKDRFASVRSVTPAGTARVFDLTVEGTHRFVLGTHVVSNCDEEPPMDVYTEALTRTNATGGILFITFTPLLGMSQVVKRFLKDKPEGTTVVTMTIEDAEHYTPEQRAKIIASYPEHEREARTRGIPMMGSGMIFPVAESSISCEPFSIPPHWARICGIDFGIDHPAGFACLAHDRDTDTLYLYEGWRFKGKTAAEHAMIVIAKGYHHIPWAWPHDGLQRDKASGQILKDQYKGFGMNMLPERAQFPTTTEGKAGGNSVEAGLSLLLERMQTRRFRVFSTVGDFFEEMRQYHRKDGLVVKEDDDLLDATRYGLMMLRKAQTANELAALAQKPNLLLAGASLNAPSFEVFDELAGY